MPSSEPSAVLSDLESALARAALAARAVTVRLGRDGRGSGIVYAEGLVLTNAHHLRDRTIQVTFADGRTAQGEVRGADADGDLAVVAVDTAGLAPLTWADTAPTLGAFVVAAHGRGRVSVGNVVATDRSFRGPRGRQIHDGFEHGAQLPRGASGGPVVNLAGRLIGIDTHRVEAGYQAITATAAVRARVEQLAGGVSPTRRTLGVALAPAGTANRVRRAAGLPETEGLLVRGVVDDSPAARAGLAEGDVLVSTGSGDVRVPLRTTDDLHAALDTAGDGPLTLHVLRGVEERTVTVMFEATTPA